MKRLLTIALALLLLVVQLQSPNARAQTSPQITVSPSSLQSGDWITVSGSGWTANSSLTIYIVELTPTVAPVIVKASVAGTFERVQFAIPSTVPSGSYTVAAQGQAAQSTPVTAGFTVIGGANATPIVQVPALLQVQPQQVVRGSNIAIAGSHFPANASVSVVGGQAGSNALFSQTVGSDGSGNVAVDITIPTNAAVGTYQVSAQAGTGTPALASFDVSASALITAITPNPAVPGSSATLTGTGFGANEAVVASYLASITSGGQQQITVIGVADSNGNVSIALPVPGNVLGNGNYIVTATGQTSNSSASAQLTVSTNSLLSASPSAVNSGGTETLTGQQFPGSTTATISGLVPLLSGGSYVLSTTTGVGSGGTFSVQLPIPANAASGSVTFTATASDPNTNQAYSAQATVTVNNVPASISLSGLSALPQDVLTLSGSGFAPGPGASITVTNTYAVGSGQETQTLAIDASANGTFTLDFAVPSDATPGNATITANQAGSGVTTSTSLEIDALPTSTPTATTTPTSTPTSTATATSVPASAPTATATATSTSAATSIPHTPVRLKIRTASLWYQTVRLGTSDHVVIRTNKQVRLPVTMRITYANGASRVYTGVTSGQGIWNKTFSVPASATNLANTLATVRITVKRNFAATTTLHFELIT